MPTSKKLKKKRGRKAPTKKSARTKPRTARIKRIDTESYRERLEARIAELAGRKDVQLLYNRLGSPLEVDRVRAAGARLGWRMTDAEVQFYARMNGCLVVWCSKRSAMFDPKLHVLQRNKPKELALAALWPVLESLPTEVAPFGVFAFLPITDMAAHPHDYEVVNSLGEGIPRIACDMPGTYYTPAITIGADGCATTRVGDDHGVAWDGAACSLLDYAETVLATWGTLEARASSFLRNGKSHMIGRAYWDAHPCTLESLLPPPPVLAPDAKAIAALRRKAHRMVASQMSAEDIVGLMHALAECTDAEAAATFGYRLQDATRRLRDYEIERGDRSHRDLLVVNVSLLERAIANPVAISHALEVVRALPVSLSIAGAVKALRSADGSSATRALIAARSGEAIVPAMLALWDELRDAPAGTAFAINDARVAIIYTALLLGKAARAMIPVLEREHPKDGERSDLDALVADGATLAIVAIDPSRASKLLPRLQNAVFSELVDRPPGSPYAEDERVERSSLIDVASRLPAAVQKSLARTIVSRGLDLGSHDGRKALLLALGTAGVDAAVELVFKKYDRTPSAYKQSEAETAEQLREFFAWHSKLQGLTPDACARFERE